MKKRLLRCMGLLTAVVMLVTSVDITAFAESATTTSEPVIIDEQEYEDETVLEADISDYQETVVVDEEDGYEEIEDDKGSVELKGPVKSGDGYVWQCVYFGNYHQINDYAVEPIKWKVLAVEGDDVFLTTERGIDVIPYHTVNDWAIWGESTIRSWLNGYDGTYNGEKIDYSDSGFMSTAFTDAEREAINTVKTVAETYEDTEVYEDKVVLLSMEDITNAKYGFSDISEPDPARKLKATTFAKSKKAFVNDKDVGYWWYKSSIHMDDYFGYAADVVDDNGVAAGIFAGVEDDYVMVRPAIHIDKKSSAWTYAGKVNSEGETVEDTIGYSITVESSIGGHVTPGTSQVKKGENLTLDFVPDAGYVVKEVLIDNEFSISGIRSYTFKKVKSNHTIKVTFSKGLKFGQSIEFTVPKSTPVIGDLYGGRKISIDLDNIPLLYEQDGATFRIGIGTKDITKKREKDWYNYKKFIENLTKDATKAGNDFLDNKYGNISNFEKGVKVGLFGYVEGTIAEDGSVGSIGGTAVLSISFKVGNEWQTFFWGVPVVIKANLELGVKQTLSVGYDFQHSEIFFRSNFAFTLPKIYLSAGVGIAHAADFSVYGSATNTLTMYSGTGTEDHLRITADISGEAGLSMKMFMLTKTVCLLNGKWKYYDSDKKKASLEDLNGKAYTASLMNIDDVPFAINRAEASGFNKIDASAMVLGGMNAEVEADAYEDVNPILLEAENGTRVLVYITDVKERTDGNHTAVVYSIYDKENNKWSDSVLVDDDDTADLYPSAVMDGNTLYIAFCDAGREFTKEEVESEDVLKIMAENMEVSYAEIDLTNGSSMVQSLTFNKYLDTNPSITVDEGKAHIVWIENQGNDPENMTGMNRIVMFDTEDMIEIMPEKEQPVVDVKAGKLENGVTVAYMLYQEDEEELESGNVLMTYQAGKTSVVESYNLYTPKFAKVKGENVLLWSSFNEEDGMYDIKYISNFEEDTVKAENIKKLLADNVEITPDFDYINGSKHSLIVCSNHKEDGTDGKDIRAFMVDGDKVYDSVAITDNKGYVTNMSIIPDGDNYMMAYTIDNVKYGEESLDINRDLVTVTMTPISRLVMENAYCDTEYIAPGGKASFVATVKNTGLEGDEKYKLQILQGEKVIAEKTIDEKIDIAEQKNLSIEAELPATFKAGDKVTIKVLTSDGKEAAGNTIELQLGATDLELQYDEAGSKITVKNMSSFDTSGKLSFVDVYDEKTVYKEIDLGSIKAGETKEVKVSREDIGIDKYKEYSIKAEVKSPDEELYYSNNSAALFFKGALVVEFDANGGNVDTKTKQVAYGAAYGELPVAEKPMYAFEGWYTEKTGGKEITADTIVETKESHTLYAHWTYITIARKQKIDVSKWYPDLQNVKKYMAVYDSGKTMKISKKGVFKSSKVGKVVITPYVTTENGVEPAKDVEPLTLVVTKPTIAKKIYGTYLEQTISANTLLVDVPTNSNTIKWSTPNEKVCSIDADTGVIKINRFGKVQVTATITNLQGGSVKLKTTLIVKKPVINVEESITLAVGDEKKITIKNVPSSMEVKWTTSDSSIVSIREDAKKVFIKANKTGKAVVAALVDGQKYEVEVNVE